MARYLESAKLYADLIRDKNRLKAQIARGTTDVFQVHKDDPLRLIIKDWNLVVRVRSVGTDSWLWGHPTQAVWGSSKWGEGSGTVKGRWVDILRRRWEWSRKQDFKKVSSEGTLVQGGVRIDLKNNTKYLRPEQVE